jgi:hypothetical protein
MTHALVSNGSRRSSAPSSFSARGAAIRPGELPRHEFNFVVFSEKASLNGYQLGTIKMPDNWLMENSRHCRVKAGAVFNCHSARRAGAVQSG